MKPLLPTSSIAPAELSTRDRLSPPLVMVGMNHRSVPVDVRERYAIATDDIEDVCRMLVDHDAIEEAVVLSTCNRVEIYVARCQGASVSDALEATRDRLGPPIRGLYHHDGDAALSHLMRVSGSLDSLVMGEPQILGQVKEAFSFARKAGTVGPILNGCFSRAFKSAKRIRTETDIARSAVSVGHVAVELAKTIFGEVAETQVLLIGAGKMGILAAKNLADSGARKVLVANRTFARGQALANKFGWTASSYGDLPYLLQAVDVVICSTGAPRPVLTVPIVQSAVEQRRYRPLFLIDIAVPRDIEAAVGDLSDVYLYNIDDLEEVSRTNRAGRKDASGEAEAIIAHELNAFGRWHRERQAAPLIAALRTQALATASAEAEKALRLLPELDDTSAGKVRKLAEIIANRILIGPVTTLKRASGTQAGTELAAAIAEAFGLEEESEEP
ncbi:MAG: glutamyl-tRNA reductase [Myxococcota bacterium]|jgi:glutamyl-tRNA reductase